MANTASSARVGARRSCGVVCSGTIAILLVLPGCPFAEWSVTVQSGMTYTGYNEVRVPSTTYNHWAKFSLPEVLDPEAVAFARVLARHTLGEGHVLSLEASPLWTRASGALVRPVNFEDEYYHTGTRVRASYHLGHYRLAYRYHPWWTTRFAAGIGLAANVTDVRIRLRGEEKVEEARYCRFAALVSLGIRWRPVWGIEARLDCDAFQVPTPVRDAPQNRTEDLTITVGWVHNERTSVHAGYRLVSTRTYEPEFYNFALMHQVLAGVTVRL